MNVTARKTAVAVLSVLSNATLVALKVIVGLLIGSVSVVSEAAHSGVDLVASVVALIAVLCIAAISFLGGKISTMFSTIGNSVAAA